MAPPSSSSSRRSGCGSRLCCLSKVIVILGILFGFIYLFVWLDTRHHTAATAVSATLSHFDLVDGPSGGGTLQYNLTADFRVRRTRRGHVDYDRAEAQASYAATERFGYDPVEPFSLNRHREHTITAVFGGSSPVDNGDTVRTYLRERSEGFYFVKLRLYYRIEFPGGTEGSYFKKSKISCTLRLPVPNTTATPVTTQLETMCDNGY